MAVKQKSIYAVIITLILLAIWASSGAFPVKAGPVHWTDGSNADTSWYDPIYSTFTIDTPAKLAGVAKLVNDGVSSGGASIDGFSGKILAIDRNLDLSAFTWVPIGSAAKPFKGTLISSDGTVKEISGMKVSDNLTYAGFIGYMDGATVGGLKFTSTGSINMPSVTQAVYVGAAVGKMVNNSTLYDITSELAITADTVTGVTYAGGIVGQSEGIVSNTVNNGTVAAFGGDVYAGGITGDISVHGLKLKKIWNHGAVTATSKANKAVYAGGIAGNSSVSINMSEENTTMLNSGVITAVNGVSDYAGGILGKVGGTATFSSNTSNSGAVNISAPSATGSYAGGLAGDIVTSQIGRDLSFPFTGTGSVTNNGGSNVYTGGIAGYIEGDLTWGKSFTNSVGITASGKDHVYSGGLLGRVSGETAFLDTAKNAGAVQVSGGALTDKPDEAYTGGLIGYSVGRVLFKNTGDGAYENSGNITVNGGTGVYTGGIVSNRAYVRNDSGDISNNVLSTGNITVAGKTKLYTGGYLGLLPADSTDKTIAGASFAQTISVTAASSDPGNIVSTGGIVGYSLGGTIDDDTFTGTISATGGADTYTGGIAGYVDGSAIHRANSGNTASAFAAISSDGFAGGVAGYLKGTVDTATIKYLSETVQTADGFAGGIAGKAQGTITGATVGDEAATDSGSVKISAASGIDRLTAGGIVGQNDGTLEVTNSLVTQIGLLSEAGQSGFNLGSVAGVLSDSAKIGAAGTPVIVKQLSMDVKADNSNAGGAVGINHSPQIFVNVESLSLTIPASGVKLGGVAGVQDVTAAIAAGGDFVFTSKDISISAQGNQVHIGGLFGENLHNTPAGLAENLTVKASGTANQIGGIAGLNTGTLAGFQAKNHHLETSGDSSEAGGIAGHSESPDINAPANISNAWVHAGENALIDSSGGNSVIGGIVGYAKNTEVTAPQIEAAIPDYAMLTVTGSSTKAGGLAGSIENGKITGDLVKTNVDNLIISGSAEASSSYFGGIAGYSDKTRVEKVASGVVNLNVDAPSSIVGGMAGYNLGSDTAIIISNNTAALSIKMDSNAASSTVGGIIGLNDSRTGDPVPDPSIAVSTIQNSRAVGTIQISSSSTVTGGMVGENRSLIANNSISDKISVSYADSADAGTLGGLAGLNTENGILYYTYSNSSLTIGGKHTLAGGLVGENKGQAIASYVDIDITGGAYGDETDYAYLGGLVGRNSGTIDKSYSVSEVTANGSYTNVGGLVGEQTAGSITNSYAAKAVFANGDHSYAGGLLGRITDGTVSTAYSAGRITAANGAYAGGFAGRYDSSSKDLLNRTYYVKDVDNDINGDLPDFAEGDFIWLNEFSKLSTILATTLQDRDYFPGLSGWDFTSNWRYGSLEAEYKYPELIRTANSGGEAGSGDDVNSSISWYVKDKDAISFELKSEAELAGLAAIVNGTVPGVEPFDFAGRTIRLANPIHIQSKQWIPIGLDEDHPFQGTLDGNNQLIDGYTLQPGYTYSGLLGIIGRKGAVENVRLEPLNVQGTQFTGALAGENLGSVFHIDIKLLNGMKISGAIVGGAIGKNTGTLDGIAVGMDGGSRIETAGTNVTAGGIIGDNSFSAAHGTFSFDSTDGVISSTANGAVIGGIVGKQTGDFSDFDSLKAAKLLISSTGAGSLVGGVIGEHTSGKLENITLDFTGVEIQALGSNSILGGVTGQSPANNSLTNVKLTAAPNGKQLTGNGTVGGIVGNKQGQGSNRFDLDNVQVKNLTIKTSEGTIQADLGGIAGKLDNTAVRQASASGSIVAASDGATVGGIAGQEVNSLLYSVNSAMNLEVSTTTGTTAVGGIVGELSTGDIGKSFDFGNWIPFYRGIYQAAVSSSAVIKATGSDSLTNLDVGGIVGKNTSASVYYTQSDANIDATGGITQAVGGVAGYSNGIIVHAAGHGNVAAESASIYHVGGVVGQAAGGEIDYSNAVSKSEAKVVVGSAVSRSGFTPATHVGGFVGFGANTKIANSFADIPVQVVCDNPDNTIYAGGFAGLLGDGGPGTGTIERSYAKGKLDIQGITGAYAGGFVGLADRYSITDAYALGDVTNTGFDTQSGGFAGVIERQASITRAYAAQDKLTATGINHAVRAYAGGFAGYNDGSIANVFARVPSITVNANGANIFAGALVGYNFRDGKATQSSYLGSLPGLGHNLGTAEVDTADNDRIASYGYGSWNFEVDSSFLIGSVTPEIVIQNGQQLNAVVLLYNGSGLDYFRLFDRTAEEKPEINQISLGTDISLGGHEWVPFTVFNGTFDGKGKSIQGLHGTAEQATSYGFAGENYGSIANVSFKDITIAAGDHTALVAGINHPGASIRGIGIESGIINGGDFTGGAVGENEGALQDIRISSLTVKGSSYTGGIAGKNSGTIDSSFLDQTEITGTGNFAGGITGDNNGPITNASLSNVTVKASNNTALVAGVNEAGITISGITVNGGTVNGGDYTGGAAGKNEGTLTGVKMSSSSVNGANYTGGLSGMNSGIVDNITLDGMTVAGSGSFAGGIVGDNSFVAEGSGKITHATLSMISVAGGESTGLIAGINHASTAINGITADGGTVNGGDYTGGATGKNEGALSDIRLQSLTLNGAGYSGGYTGINSGTIENVTLDKAAVTGSGNFAGGVAGDNSFVAEGSGKIAAITLTDVAVTALEHTGLVAGTNHESASIDGINATGGKVGGSNFVGGITGQNEGAVTNNQVKTLTVNGVDNVGGITGDNSGPITNVTLSNATVKASNNTALVTGVNEAGATISGITVTDGTVNGGDYTGGAAGKNAGTLSNVKINSTTVKGADYTGGLSGQNSGVIEQVSIDVTLSGTGENTGGVAGVNEGKINHTYSSGSITGSDSESLMFGGGIVGLNKEGGEINESFSYADISFKANQTAIGGIAGGNLGVISKTYFSGSVSVEGTDTVWAGGIAGHAISGEIDDSLNYGTVAASIGGQLVPGKSFFGGIAGQKEVEAAINRTAFNKQMIKANTAYYDAEGKKVAGTEEGAAGMLSSELASGTMPAGLNDAAWIAAPGFYPQLAAFNGTDASTLSAAAVIFNEKDNIGSIKSDFELTNDARVVWTASPDEMEIVSGSDSMHGTVKTANSAVITATVNGASRSITLNVPMLLYTETANAPQSATDYRIFSQQTSVVLHTDESGEAKIYYTLDGSLPDQWSAIYTDPIVLTDTTTIKAITIAEGKEPSEVFAAVWTKKDLPSFGGGGAITVPAVEKPEITAQIGENKMETDGKSAVPVARNSVLKLSVPDGQTIYYTTDGSIPTTESPQYTGEILITGNMTVKMITDNSDQVTTLKYEVKNAKYQIKQNAGEIKYVSGYENNEFKPDASLSRYEITELLTPLLDKEDVAVGSTFGDVDRNMENLVAFFTSAGIIEGYPDHTFGGDKGLTRAEFVAIMSRVLKLKIPDTEETSFSDVEGHWSAKYVDAFVKAGYVDGFPDGTFKPDEEITRAQAVVLVNRIIGVKKQPDAAAKFTDLPSSHWAYQDIMAAAK